MAILNCILGIVFIFLLAFLLSNNKKKINWRTVIIGFVIQFGFALIALKWSVGKYVLSKISLGVQSVIDYANEGIKFLFGSLNNNVGILDNCFILVIAIVNSVTTNPKKRINAKLKLYSDMIFKQPQILTTLEYLNIPEIF